MNCICLKKIGIPIVFCMLITSCAPTTHTFTTVAPAKHSMAFETITINPFQVGSHRGSTYGEQLKQMLENTIANEGYLRVVTSSPITLNGNLNISDIRTDSYTSTAKRTYGSGKTETVTYHHYIKKLTITGNYSLFDQSTNRTITGDTICANLERKKSAEKSSQARAALPTDEEMVSVALTQITNDIVAAVSPHQQTVSRELKTGKDSNIALGITYLRNGRTDQAVAIWTQVIQQSMNAKDRAAACYNIGVVEESQGNYQNAFEYFSTANSLDITEELYMKAMTRVENAQRDRGRVYQQTP